MGWSAISTAQLGLSQDSEKCFPSVKAGHLNKILSQHNENVHKVETFVKCLFEKYICFSLDIILVCSG